MIMLTTAHAYHGGPGKSTGKPGPVQGFNSYGTFGANRQPYPTLTNGLVRKSQVRIHIFSKSGRSNRTSMS